MTSRIHIPNRKDARAVPGFIKYITTVIRNRTDEHTMVNLVDWKPPIDEPTAGASFWLNQLKLNRKDSGIEIEARHLIGAYFAGNNGPARASMDERKPYFERSAYGIVENRFAEVRSIGNPRLIAVGILPPNQSMIAIKSENSLGIEEEYNPTISSMWGVEK